MATIRTDLARFFAPPAGGPTFRVSIPSHIPPTHENKTAVKDALVEHFSIPEMRDVVARTSARDLDHIHIVHDGTTKTTVAWAIVEWFDRHHSNLFELVREMLNSKNINFDIGGAPTSGESARTDQPPSGGSTYRTAPPRSQPPPSPRTPPLWSDPPGRTRPETASAAAGPRAVSRSVDRRTLVTVLVTRLDPSERRLILYDLTMRPDEVLHRQGVGEDEAIAIVSYCSARGRLEDLITALVRRRPDVREALLESPPRPAKTGLEGPVSEAGLTNILEKRFDANERRQLLWWLIDDPESVLSATSPLSPHAEAETIVRHLQRLDRLSDLADEIRRRRPGIPLT